MHRQLDHEQSVRNQFKTPILNRRMQLPRSQQSQSSCPPSQRGLGNMNFIKSVIDHHRKGGDCDEIEEAYNIDTNKPIILFTQHSVTTEFDLATQQLRPSLSALEQLSLKKDYQIFVTYPNNDAGGRKIIEEINSINNSKIKVFQSLGRYFYHGVLALSLDDTKNVVCVGNSSSGIKETPAFGCPTVNIGSRQDSRLRGKNVVDTSYDEKEIVDAITYCIEDKEFRELCKNSENPYGTGDAGMKIANVLAEIEISRNLLKKKMTLLGKREGDWFS